MKVFLGILLCLASALSLAQDTAPKAELKLEKSSAVAGSIVKGKIVLTFAAGLHGYQNPPSESYQIPVKVEPVKGTTLLKAIYPKGEPFLMSGDEKPSMVYANRIEIPIQIKAPAKAGKQVIKLSLSYQQCNESACFPPGTLDLVGKLTVTAPVKKKKSGK
jgi:DsbC/DsbD-like thiol-disulfide interchange protein